MYTEASTAAEYGTSRDERLRLSSCTYDFEEVKVLKKW
jgi:hypothetical protein